jgi:glycosyltransferase involved in cell wall biosynthesis
MAADVSTHSRGDGRLDIRHLVVRPREAHPTQANGVVCVARQLVREQRAAGDNAHLVMIGHEGASGPADDPTNDPLVPTRIVPPKGLAIRGRVVRLRGDVISALLADAGKHTFFHIHGGREPLLPGLARALRRRGIPYAVTLHGRFSHIYDRFGRCQTWRGASYARLVERGMLEGARFVQALSAHEADTLRRIAPRARIEVLGNGVYSRQLETVPVRPAKRPPSRHYPHFVYCGRYAIGHKGLDLLVEGFARYRHQGGKGRLTTYGTGPDRESLIRMAKDFCVENATEFAGPLFGEARDAALQRCDYFVMASRYEGLPLAALEAALLGLPLIVTEGTGLRAKVKAAGAGVPIEDLTAEGVCAALHRAAAQSAEQWAASSAAAFALAVTIGDWTAIASHLRTLYEKPVSAAPRWQPVLVASRS